MEHFASFEDMVFAADLLVEGEVVGIEPGRVIEPPGHREELTVATLSVERVIHRSDAVAAPPDQVAIEFSRFVDIEGHGRRRIIRADGGERRPGRGPPADRGGGAEGQSGALSGTDAHRPTRVIRWS